MSIKEKAPGVFFVQIDGRAGIPRVRKSFATRREAELFEREYLLKHSVEVKPDADTRTLLDLVALWHRYHGINLADGDRRKRKLEAMAVELKNPVAAALSAEAFVEWRYDKLYGKARVQAKTVNNMHGYLAAMFERLRKLKIIDYRSPICEVEFVKIQERQLSYLSKEQIATVLAAIEDGCENKSTYFVAEICLRTGARWGEAEQLRMKQLRDGRVTFEFTKSKKTRTIPLDAVFYGKLMAFAGQRSPNDRVFTNCIGAFRRAVARSGIELPRGQCSHILRHSFASHFVMQGGSILTLQKILGHASIEQTMTYAHLAPEHLADAIKLNPRA